MNRVFTSGITSLARCTSTSSPMLEASTRSLPNSSWAQARAIRAWSYGSAKCATTAAPSATSRGSAARMSVVVIGFLLSGSGSASNVGGQVGVGACMPRYFTENVRVQVRQCHAPGVAPRGRRSSSAQYGQW